MPMAICSCGQLTPWRNQRGVRLADLRCSCGKALRRAVWTPEGWQAPPVKPSQARPPLETCALCGRRRRVPGGGIRVTTATDYPVHRRGTPVDQVEARTVHTGEVVCGSHEPRYPVQVD